MKIGIIVGRFQSPRLTEGHESLIREVMEENERVIIFVGVYPKCPDFRNPIPFKFRKQMLLEFAGDYGIEVIPFKDVFNVPLWNSLLDEKIGELTNKNDEITLYGSRESFIFGYNGKYKTKEIKADGDFSATQLRNQVLELDEFEADEKFRAGIILGLMLANKPDEA